MQGTGISQPHAVTYSSGNVYIAGYACAANFFFLCALSSVAAYVCLLLDVQDG